jgi:small conductance mechanosensitive channel
MEQSKVNDVVSETVAALNDKVDVVEQITEYGSIIGNSFYFFIIGLFGVFIIHWLTSKFIYPYINDKRFIKTLIGSLYVFVLAISVLLALKSIGFDVQIFAKVTLISIFIGAIAFFFLLPFLPRLPFKLGDMIEVNGIIGSVDSISSFHTTIRQFNGNMVFIPNALVVSGKIINYHDTSSRRITFKIQVTVDSDIEKVKQLVLKIMQADKRVLNEPSSASIFITNADAVGLTLEGYCWVNNPDFLNARSDLWLSIIKALLKDDSITLSIPKQGVHLFEK